MRGFGCQLEEGRTWANSDSYKLLNALVAGMPMMEIWLYSDLWSKETRIYDSLCPLSNSKRGSPICMSMHKKLILRKKPAIQHLMKRGQCGQLLLITLRVI